MFTNQDGNKHGNKYTIAFIFATVAFTAVTPISAMAAEADYVPRFTALASPEARDPYLAQAINNLPDYSFTTAGSSISTPSPITKIGNWPVKRTWKPVTTPFTATQPTPQPTVTPSAVPVPSKPAPAPVAAAAPTKTGEATLVMEGEASYYSRAGCLGCSPNMTMANGQPLNDSALTMAIGADKKHLVGHTARVTSLATGKSVMVRITDTGGFYKAKYGNRVADLTIGTKQAIGMAGGVGQVRVEVF